MTEKEEALVRAIWKDDSQKNCPDASEQETENKLEKQTKKQAS